MPTVTYLKRNPPMAVEQGVTSLFLRVNVGATGAVSAISGYGISGVVRNSAGDYTITFDRKYKKLLDCSLTVVQSTAQGLGLSVKTDSVSSAGTLNIVTSVGATATDPSSGTVLRFQIAVGDTGMTGGVA
jgi:hypothetical protein